MLKGIFSILSTMCLALLAGCNADSLSTLNPSRVTEKNNVIVKVPSVSNATMDSGQLVLTGVNLDSIDGVSISGNSISKTFTIISKSATQLSASITSGSALNILGGMSYNLLISSASAQTIIPITFTILDNSITSAKIQSSAITTAKIATRAVTYDKIEITGASNGQVMTYNSTSGKWGPANSTGTGGGGGISSIFPGTGIVFNNGGSGSGSISSTGSIGIDVGTDSGQIAQYDPTDGFLLVNKGELRLVQENSGTLDDGLIRQIFYIDDGDEELVIGTDILENDIQWKFNNLGEYILYDDVSGLTQLKFSQDGTGDGMTVGGNMTVTGTSNFVGAVTIDDATVEGILDVDGDLNVEGTFTNPSDQRLKNILAPVDDVLEKLLNIPVVNYQYKKDNALGIKYFDPKVGVVAQNLQTQIPQAVSQNKDGFLYVKQDAMIYYLLKGLQESESARRDNAEKFKTMHEGHDQRLATLERQVQQLQEHNQLLLKYLCAKDASAPFCPN
jgi:hypothetical protein